MISKEDILFTVLPIISIIGSVIGIVAIFYFNFMVKSNQDFNLWCLLGVFAMLIWGAMGLIAYNEAR